MSNQNWRNLKPQYVEQDKFGWVQENNLVEDRELVEVFLYKAINLTTNSLNIFKDATNQLLNIRLFQNPTVIKMKPLIATGGVALKTTFDNMIANIAFAKQPEFMCWNPLIQELFNTTTNTPQDLGLTSANENAYVGEDLYFVRVENTLSPEKATWYTVNNIQTQVNTDNSFSIAKLRLTPFNQGLLPSNIKLKFDLTSNRIPKKVKKVVIQTKRHMRFANIRFNGTEQSPIVSFEEPTNKTWKYDRNSGDYPNYVFVKEFPISVSGENVVWKSDWLEQANRQWNQCRNGQAFQLPSNGNQGTIFTLSANNTVFSTYQTYSKLDGFPRLGIDATSFNFPFQDSQAGTNADIRNSAICLTKYNQYMMRQVLGSMGKWFDDTSGLIGSPNEGWFQKTMTANPYFCCNSSYTTNANYGQINYQNIARGELTAFQLGGNLITLAIIAPDQIWTQPFVSNEKNTTPDRITRLESMLQERGIPYIAPAYSQLGVVAFSNSNLEALNSRPHERIFFNELPPEKLEAINPSSIGSSKVDASDDKKYIWVAYNFTGITYNDNFKYATFPTNGVAPDEYIGDNLGYAIVPSQVVIPSSTGINVKNAFFAYRDFGYYSSETINYPTLSDRNWVDEDLGNLWYYDRLVERGIAPTFTDAQIRTWYNTFTAKSIQQYFDRFITQTGGTEWAQTIILDEASYLERISFIYHNQGPLIIKLYDESGILVDTIKTEFPQSPTATQFTIALQ